MKKLFVVLTALALIAGMGMIKAEAAGTADITVTVTLQNISVQITAGDSLPLGILSGGTSSAAQDCTAKNNGNVNEAFAISVANSTNWHSGAISGIDTFVMTLDGTTALTPSASLASSISPDATKDFTLTLTMPSVGSTFVAGGETIVVTVSASAA